MAQTVNVIVCPAFCRRHGAELAVMKATGGDERMAFLLLWQEGVPAP
jgi:hypothetical protein